MVSNATGGEGPKALDSMADWPEWTRRKWWEETTKP